MRLACAALALALATSAHAQAQTSAKGTSAKEASVKGAGLDEAQVRAFVAPQEKAWNAGEVDRYFAAFMPGAVFRDQARTGDRIVPYGTATLAQAKTQSRRFFAKAKVVEVGTILRVRVAPDRRSARVVSTAVSRTTRDGKTETACIARVQTLVLTGGRLTSTGQTDTISRCRR